jgi:hypothetical protein
LAQVPQQDQQFPRDASPAPVSAPDQHDGNDNVRDSERNVSRAAQRNQIGIVLVDGRENAGQPEKPKRGDTDAIDH